MTDLEQNFEKRWNCEIEEKSDLSSLKDAKKNEDLRELMDAIGMVQGDHDREELVKSGIWIFRIKWNEKVERVQISAYGYSSGITYEPEEGSPE